MKASAFIAVVFLALASNGSPLSGVKAEDVSVRLDAVTVSLAQVTVTESEVSCKVVGQPEMAELVSIVRDTARAEAERLSALFMIRDQDVLFLLCIMPGVDSNMAIRKAAIDRFSDIDLIRDLASIVQVEGVKCLLEKRLNGLGVNSVNGQSHGKTLRAYIRRMKLNKLKYL